MRITQERVCCTNRVSDLAHSAAKRPCPTAAKAAIGSSALHSTSSTNCRLDRSEENHCSLIWGKAVCCPQVAIPVCMWDPRTSGHLVTRSCSRPTWSIRPVRREHPRAVIEGATGTCGSRSRLGERDLVEVVHHHLGALAVKRRAMALPIPDPAPVTTARRPRGSTSKAVAFTGPGPVR